MHNTVLVRLPPFHCSGANVNYAAKNRVAPLMVAVHKGHTEVVKALLAAGAQVCAQG